jgi:hypothetical protein
MRACHRYIISHLRIDIDRYHVQALYIWGRLGATSVPLDLLDEIIMDGFSCHWPQVEPIYTSPWLLSVPFTGIGILTPNPGGKVWDRDGLRGSVHLCPRGNRSGISSKPGKVGVLARSRERYRNWKPSSNSQISGFEWDETEIRERVAMARTRARQMKSESTKRSFAR